MNKEKESSKPVVVISLVTALCLIGDSMLYIALPIYYNKVGLQSLWEVGLILSLNRLIRIPVNPFVGWLYRKMSLRTGTLLAVSIAVITTVGYGVAYGLLAWFILRILWGVAWSLFRLGGFFTVMASSTDSNRGRLMGMYNGLYRLGSLVGMLAGGILVSMYGISLVSIIFGMFMIVGIPFVLMMIPAGKAEAELKPKKMLLEWLTKPVLKIVLTGLLLAFLIQGMFTSTLTLVMSEHYGEVILLFGVALGVTALSGILQGLRWAWEPFLAIYFGRLSDGKSGRLPLFISFMLVGAVCLSLIPFAMPLPIWLIIVLIFMAVSTILTTLSDAVTSDIARTSDPNIVMTYYTVFLDTGAALGPLVSFFIIGLKNGIELTFWLGGAILFLLSFVWLNEYRIQQKLSSNLAKKQMI